MARLPQPGGDAGNWGSILNDYLVQSHKSDGTLKDNSVTSSSIADEAVTTAALALGSITNAKLANDAISKNQLQLALRTEIEAKITQAAADTTYAPISVQAEIREVVEMPASLAKMYRKLDQAESANANLLVLGDSTGNATDEWPYLLAVKIAAAYPNHTVKWALWVDATKNFPVGDTATIQTGTNGLAITIWNVSVSGEVVGYAQNNHTTIRSGLSAGGALPPDVIFFNYGHNSPQLGADYRAIQIEAINLYTNFYPSAAIVQIAQNPRATSDPSYANDQNKQAVISQMALDEGHVLVDVNSDWVALGDYSALVDVDGLHPTPLGSQRWADLVWEIISPKSRITFAGKGSRSDYIWIPAADFFVSQGVPELALHGVVPAWSLDPDATESVVATVAYPTDWTAVNVVALMLSAGTSGVATMRCNYAYLGNQSGTFTTGVALSTFTQGTAANVSVGATLNGNAPVRLQNRIAWSQRPLALQVQRDAAAGADTLTTDVFFAGVAILKAS